MRILVVEDEDRLAQDLQFNLAAAGFVVERVSDGREAWLLGDTETYACIILDLGLPGMDGLTILKQWRINELRTPVLVLTARGSWTERVAGINAGADDYLPKPFEIDELIARVRAIIRRSAGHAAPIVRVGDILLDELQVRVSVAGKPINLSSLEFRAASYLIRHSGRVVPQQELMDSVYGAAGQPEINTLEVLIGRIRRKLGADRIKTIRGQGYFVDNGFSDP